MDPIKTIADGIRAERKEALEQKQPASKDDVVQAVAPSTDKKAQEPEAEQATEDKAAGQGKPADDENKE